VNIPPASDRMVQPNRYGLNRTFGAAIGTIALVVLIAGTTVFLATGQVRNANAARDRSRDILARRIGFLNSEFARWFALGVADVSEAPGRLMKNVFRDENLPGVSRPWSFTAGLSQNRA
jgi:hypothetical protein